MSLGGWGKIDFNWKDKGTTMGFYGCNSANMVGRNPGEGKKATRYLPFSGDFPKANPMNVYRNRQKLRSDFQPRAKKK